MVIMPIVSQFLYSNAIIFKLSMLMILAPLLLGCKSSGGGIDFTPDAHGSNNSSLTKKERELQHVEHKIAAAYARFSEIDEQVHHKQSQLAILDRLTQQHNVRLNQQKSSLALLNIDLQQKEESLLACSEQLEDKANQLSTQQTNVRMQQQNLDDNTAQIEQKQQILQIITEQINSKQVQLENKVNQLNQYEVNLETVMVEIDRKRQSLQTITDQISLKQQELGQKNNQLNQYEVSLVELTREIDTKQQSLRRVNDNIASKQRELSNINDEIILNRQLLAQRNTLLSDYDDSIALKNNRLDELDAQTTVKGDELLQMDRQLQRKQDQLLQQSQPLFAFNAQTLDQAMIENINIKKLADNILKMIELYFQLSGLDNRQSQERSPTANLAGPVVIETSSQLNDLRTKIVDELKVFYRFIQQNYNSANASIDYIDNFSLHNSSFASDINTQGSYSDEEEFQKQVQVEMADVQVQTTDEYIVDELNNKLSMLSYQNSIYIRQQQEMSDENRKLKDENSDYRRLNDELMTHVNNLSINLRSNEHAFERGHNELESLRLENANLQRNNAAMTAVNRIIQQNLNNALDKNRQLESDISVLKNELSMTKKIYQDELLAFVYKEAEYKEKI